MIKAGKGAQRPVEAYYLNENQAAYVSILSRTRTAANIWVEIVQEVEGEPRILDTDLGKALGMVRPENIRQTIKGNLEDLQRFGPLHAENAMVNLGSGAQRSVEAYYLNDEPAAAI